MTSPVCLEACPHYDAMHLEEALENALARLRWFENRPPQGGKRILLKPNMLAGVPPERAVTTHPAVVEAAVRVFVKRGFTVFVGDSPALDSTAVAARKSGIAEAVERAGGHMADFQETVEVAHPEGRLVKRFSVAKAVRDADMVVTIAKLKTHGQMYYTGAIKNLFGCVVGLQKSQFHVRFVERRTFARMIVDLARLVKPQLAIMDGVVAMEGVGPMGGTPKPMGFLGVSQDPLALDWTCASLMGYDPHTIPILADALERGSPWMSTPEDIVHLSEPPERFRPASFERVRVLKDIAFVRRFLPGALYRFARNCIVPRPRFRHGLCIRCGKCINICAAGALAFEGEAPRKNVVISHKKCIQCYCCHEVCPVDAIVLRRRPGFA